MSIVEGTFVIKCDKSGAEYTFTPNDAEFEPTGGEERQMGAENQYTWSTSFTDDVNGEEIEIEYEVWEYPVGMFNDESIEVKGAKVLKTFSYNFHEEPEPYNDEEPLSNLKDTDLDLDF